MRTTALVLLATCAAIASASDAGGAPKPQAPAGSATSAYRLGAADLDGLRAGLVADVPVVEGATARAGEAIRIQGSTVPDRTAIDITVPAAAVGARKPFRLADGRLASYAVVTPAEGKAMVVVFWAVDTVATQAKSGKIPTAPAGH